MIDESDRAVLRALGHPLRLRLLDALSDGASTATILAERLGESSGATSYHLRVLAKARWIEEDPALGGGRERWWRRVARPTGLIATGADDPDGRALEARFWSILAQADDDSTRRFFERLPDLDSDARAAAAVFHAVLRMTRDEATALAADLIRLTRPYRREHRPQGEGTALYSVGVRVLPIEDDTQG